jgi:hypothetical protein
MQTFTVVPAELVIREDIGSAVEYPMGTRLASRAESFADAVEAAARFLGHGAFADVQARAAVLLGNNSGPYSDALVYHVLPLGG